MAQLGLDTATLLFISGRAPAISSLKIDEQVI